MEIERIDIDAIREGARLRPLDETRIEGLMKSISEIGLQTPITVWLEQQGEDYIPHLVTGAHRRAACKRLGWEYIDAFVTVADDIDRQLWEIAENLHRAELTALERDQHVAKWVELTAAKVSQVGTPSGGHQPKAKGVRAAERDLGISKNDASRALKVAGLTDEAKAAAVETGLDDNRTALLEAAKAAPERQADAVRDIANRKAVMGSVKSQDTKRLEDRDAKDEADDAIAALLAEHIPGEQWDALKANLYTAGYRGLAKAFTRLTGTSVFDNTSAGRAA